MGRSLVETMLWKVVEPLRGARCLRRRRHTVASGHRPGRLEGHPVIHFGCSPWANSREISRRQERQSLWDLTMSSDVEETSDGPQVVKMVRKGTLLYHS